jgi:hypothetical protein
LKRIFNKETLSGLADVTTFADRLLFFLLVCLSVSGLFFIRSFFPSGSLVKIYADDKTAYVLPLGEDQVVTVEGPLGSSVVEVKDGKVHMKDSPCPRKICVNQGWTDRGAITCLPNNVMIIVHGDEHGLHDTEYDAVTR